MSAPAANNDGGPSHKAADKLVNATDTTGAATVSSGSKDSKELTHFDASSFTLEDLLRASTEVFSKNRYWIAYLVTMEIGEQLLVKRLKKELSWNDDAVVRKILDLGKLKHKNILAPKAFYYSKEEALYITDYIRNGSVSSFLHPSVRLGPQPLRWSIRLSIIVGITRGLVFLHTHENLVHGYLTSENVLLDVNYNPLIADVGLSMLTHYSIPKSYLNHAPELFKFQDANVKSDVYCLGLIMLQLLTGKSADSEKEGITLPAWVMSVLREGWILEVFDVALLRYENIEQELVAVLELATACVSISPEARPKADEILQRLEEIESIAEKKAIN